MNTTFLTADTPLLPSDSSGNPYGPIGLVTLLASFFAAFFVLRTTSNKSIDGVLPPGPKGWPILGIF